VSPCVPPLKCIQKSKPQTKEIGMPTSFVKHFCGFYPVMKAMPEVRITISFLHLKIARFTELCKSRNSYYTSIPLEKTNKSWTVHHSGLTVMQQIQGCGGQAWVSAWVTPSSAWRRVCEHNVLAETLFTASFLERLLIKVWIVRVI